jgi:hypothetical protein
MKPVLIALILLFLPLHASAQGDLDPDAPSIFGSLEFSPALTLDPFVVSMASGGDVNASALDQGEECRGYITGAPSFAVTWADEIARLRLFYVSVGDTTLIVRAPDGSLLCSDDDGLLLNGAIEIVSPVTGEYDVWVGSYYPDEQVAGYLMLTRSEEPLEAIAEAVAVGGIPASPAPPEEVTGGIVFDANPEFGQTALASGFQPDPLIVTVETGGTIDTAALDLGIGCVGYTGAEPDFRLEWSGDSSQLRLFVVAETDSTLIVRAPNGAFRCNDDFPGSRNPLVEFARPDEGSYSIWIGSFREGETGVGTLYMTEFSTLDPLAFETEQ